MNTALVRSTTSDTVFANEHRNRQFCLLLLIVLSIALELLSTRAAGAGQLLDKAEASEIPAPDGLSPCPSDSPIASMLAQAVGNAGKVSACFVSIENVRLAAVPQPVNYPVEYAFAIRLAVQSTGPYTKQDIEINLSQVVEKWKAYPPLAVQSKEEYQKRINDLLTAIGTEPLRRTLAEPLLVSIDRLGDTGFSVVSIRQRNVSMGANSMVSTAVDGSVLMLKGGQLIRLTLVRELRAASDTDLVKKAIAAWVHDAYQSDGSVSN